MKKIILMAFILILLGAQVNALDVNHGGTSGTVISTSTTEDMKYWDPYFYLTLDSSHRLKYSESEVFDRKNRKVTIKRERIIEELQNQCSMSEKDATSLFENLFNSNQLVKLSAYIEIYRSSERSKKLVIIDDNTVTYWDPAYKDTGPIDDIDVLHSIIYSAPIKGYFYAGGCEQICTHFQKCTLSNFTGEPEKPQDPEPPGLIVDPKIPMPDNPQDDPNWPNNGTDYAPNDAQHPYVTKSGYGLPLVIDLSMSDYTQPQNTNKIIYTGWKIKEVKDVFAMVKPVNTLSSNPEFNILYSPKSNIILNKSQLELEPFIQEQTDHTFRYRFRLKQNPGSIINARCLYNPPNQPDSLENEPYQLQVLAGATITITQYYKYAGTETILTKETQPIVLYNKAKSIFIKIKGSMFDDDQPVITR